MSTSEIQVGKTDLACLYVFSMFIEARLGHMEGEVTHLWQEIDGLTPEDE